MAPDKPADFSINLIQLMESKGDKKGVQEGIERFKQALTFPQNADNAASAAAAIEATDHLVKRDSLLMPKKIATAAAFLGTPVVALGTALLTNDGAWALVSTSLSALTSALVADGAAAMRNEHLRQARETNGDKLLTETVKELEKEVPNRGSKRQQAKFDKLSPEEKKVEIENAHGAANAANTSLNPKIERAHAAANPLRFEVAQVSSSDIGSLPVVGTAKGPQDRGR